YSPRRRSLRTNGGKPLGSGAAAAAIDLIEARQGLPSPAEIRRRPDDPCLKCSPPAEPSRRAPLVGKHWGRSSDRVFWRRYGIGPAGTPASRAQNGRMARLREGTLSVLYVLGSALKTR